MFLHTRFQVRTVGQREWPRPCLEHQGSRSGKTALTCRKSHLCEVLPHAVPNGLGGTQLDPLAARSQVILRRYHTYYQGDIILIPRGGIINQY